MPSELETGIKKLLEDENAKALQTLLNDFNPFRVLGIETYEIRHSNTLAWLFDPAGSHKLGSAFLKAFLRSAASIEGENAQQSSVDDWLLSGSNQDFIVYREVTLSNLKAEYISAPELQENDLRVPNDKKRRALDILIEGPRWQVAIELKIRASQSENQLDDYRKAIKKRSPEKKNVFYYLSNNLDEDIPKPWIPLTWATNILPILRELSPSDSHVGFFIRCFTSSVEEHCEEGVKANLVNNLLKSHGPVLDRIKGIPGKEVNEIRKIITSDRSKRFIDTELLSRYTVSNKIRNNILLSFIAEDKALCILPDCEIPLLKFAIVTWPKISWLAHPRGCGALIEIENLRKSIRFKLLIRDRKASSPVPHAELRSQLASYIKSKKTSEFKWKGTDATIWTSKYLKSPECESAIEIRSFFYKNVAPVLNRFTSLVEEFNKTIVPHHRVTLSCTPCARRNKYDILC